MKFINSAIFSIALILVLSFSAFAQETQEKVVDEVVAQVNDGVITLSRIKREIKTAVDSFVAEGKSREEGERLMEEKKGELIANLINEELLVQKAKEAGLEKEVEANLNQRFLEIMKEQKIKTIESLYQAMEAQGINPQEIREIWRKQATREAVITREVNSKLYWSFSPKELKDYYEKNKDKFTKPEKVTLSEIFLSFAGRDEAAVREKAKQIVAKLRAGENFEKLAIENSDRENVAKNKGKVDTFIVKDLDPKFGEAIKNLKTGGVSDPVEIDQVGIEILHVDERVAASNESSFDENAIRYALMQERAPIEQKKFMSSLRQDAYIKISEQYRPIVSPILFADERRAEKTDK